MKKRVLLFSLTKKDFKFEYFSGSGAGGQHRNKCQNSCRCKHILSGAIGMCQDQRSKNRNTKMAFRRCVETKEFQNWIKLEASRYTGDIARIEQKIERELKNNTKCEVKSLTGKWVECETF